MKKLLGVIATLITIAVPPAMQAHEGFYAGGFAGVNFLDVRPKHHAHLDVDTGYTLGAVLGYKINDDFRLEGEFAYRHNDFDKLKYHSEKISLHGHTRSLSFMANGYYDFSVEWAAVPYVGVGIGYENRSGHLRHNETKMRINDNQLAWQVMAGLNYDVSEKVQMNVEYKLHSTKDNDAYDHALVVGAKHYF